MISDNASNWKSTDLVVSPVKYYWKYQTVIGTTWEWKSYMESNVGTEIYPGREYLYWTEAPKQLAVGEYLPAGKKAIYNGNASELNGKYWMRSDTSRPGQFIYGQDCRAVNDKGYRTTPAWCYMTKEVELWSDGVTETTWSKSDHTSGKKEGNDKWTFLYDDSIPRNE